MSTRNFLNSGAGYDLFEAEALAPTYVDKTMLIDEVCRYRVGKRYICITRPRRFGKTVAANMIAAFFDESTAKKSRALFEGMQIGRLKESQEKASAKSMDPSLCWPQQGKHKVIRINMIDLISDKTQSYLDFRKKLDRRMLADLNSVYPALSLDEADLGKMDLSEILERTNDRFVFVIDEWDALFEKSFMTEADKEAYIDFLKNLLKDKAYVHLAYMTGILPIAKYSSGSPLNMFDEFHCFNDVTFHAYFGLTKKEISALMREKGLRKPTLRDLASWYDGYVQKGGVHVYNPSSVSKALRQGVCMDNWGGTGRMNEIRLLLQNNVEGLRDDIIRMVSGETLDIQLGGFSVAESSVGTRDEILSAMVVYGFLSYYKGKLRIPNRELMLKFKTALASQPMGLKQTLDNSMALLKATLARDEEKVARLVEQVHDENIPHVHYNDENSLACVVVVGYLAARDMYDVKREDPSGKGYADFVFEPYAKGSIPVILELKYNHSAKNAIESIHKRGYIARFKNHRRVLLVGINYSTATKKHTCLTELVEQ